MDGVRLAQRERRNLRVEAGAGLRDHLIRPLHDAEGRTERTPGRVLEGISRRQRRLFADDARATNFLDLTGAVGDDPMPANQLHGDIAFVGNPDGVEKEPLLLGGLR